MKIYLLDHDFRYQSLVTVDEKPVHFMNRIGQPLSRGWTPLHLKVPEKKKELPPSDFPGFLPNAPVFSRRAKELFQNILHALGEFLPVTVNQNPSYFFV
ncbi:hypothetical protein JQC72_04075 [Polycladomyces sp. WAk]|uniref:Uncharacterized protein n=1 Tax=Polycladomyces zharkentensis TaxID=2807616 RepID=A0ABS2WGP5_9BACL|nr:hypothetical protein [Polycladomyces sp. WAk]MBN2908697.1 hypothetical protein [Polycladomyces sp. WAk]